MRVYRVVLRNQVDFGENADSGKLIDLPLIVLLREPLQRNLSAFFQNETIS